MTENLVHPRPNADLLQKTLSYNLNNLRASQYKHTG